jgi:hypothetical protein
MLELLGAKALTNGVGVTGIDKDSGDILEEKSGIGILVVGS